MSRLRGALAVLVVAAFAFCATGGSQSALANTVQSSTTPHVLFPTNCVTPGQSLSILGSHFDNAAYIMIFFDHVVTRNGKMLIVPWFPAGPAQYFVKRPDSEGYVEQSVPFLKAGPTKAPLGITHIHVFGADPTTGGGYGEIATHTLLVARSCPRTVKLTVDLTYLAPRDRHLVLVSGFSTPHAQLAINISVGSQSLPVIRQRADGSGHYKHSVRLDMTPPVDALAVVHATVSQLHPATAFRLLALTSPS